MTNAALILNGLFALLLIYAAIRDVQTYTIKNQLVLIVAALAVPYWWAAGLDLWPDVAWRVGIALAVFAILAIGFYIGMMGGGDVKLGAACALWFAPMGVFRFLIIMSLSGALVTLVALAHHKMTGKAGKTKVPYGVAIAIGALANLTQRFLNHFA